MLLGATPRLFGRPLLGCRHTAWANGTLYKHDFLRRDAFGAAGRAGYKSKVAGDNESGHIEAGENERMLFIDSEYESAFGLWNGSINCFFSLQFRLRIRRYFPSKASLPHMASIR